MKPLLPLCALLLFLASCTTAYKTGQTPDDVYFSPARPQDEYVRSENKQDKYSYNEQSDDDRYLRMKVRNRRTWSDLDYYYSDPYAYNYNRYNNFNLNSLYYNTPWNHYSSWNYFYNPYSNYYNSYNPYNPYYNPYGSKVIIVNRKPSVYSRPRMFNLNTYNPQPNTNATHPRSSSTRRAMRSENRYYNNNNSNNQGDGLRSVFGNNKSSNTSTQNNTPSRSERPAATAPAPSPSRSSSNAPVRKF